MASKRQPPWPRFDDPSVIEALSRRHTQPPEDWEDAAAESFPEAAAAYRLARWFKAAADALVCHDLPDHERQRLGAAVEAVTRGPLYTEDDKRRAIIRIIDSAAKRTTPHPSPEIDDGPELSLEEERLTPQQRWAAASLWFFSFNHPVDGRRLDREALLKAVLVWREKDEPGTGFTTERRALGGGKYRLVAAGIRRTSFKCSAATIRDLARPPRSR